MRAITVGHVGLKKAEPQEHYLLMEEDTPLSPSEMTPRQWSWGVKASLERARMPAVDIGMGQHSITSALQRSFASSASRNLQGHPSVWHPGKTQALHQGQRLRCTVFTIRWPRALIWGCTTAAMHCGTPLPV